MTMIRSPRFDRLDSISPLADLFAVFFDVGMITLVAVFLAIQLMPSWQLPWTALSINDPVGLPTHMKIAGTSPMRCLALLSEAGVRYRRTPDRSDADFCQIRDAVVITGGMAGFSPSGPPLACHQALALAIWDRQVVQPAAREIFGQGVTAITHYGSYNCRRQYDRAAGPVSEHASANALDVSGFRLADGRSIQVARDFRTDGPRAAFLRRVRDQGCGVFTHTLSPDFNTEHRDHFHLDMGGWPSCR